MEKWASVSKAVRMARVSAKGGFNLFWGLTISTIISAIGVILVALLGLPLFLWFAPDRIDFLLNVLVYVRFALIVGTIYQGIALKFSYGKYNHRRLLSILTIIYNRRLIDVYARVRSQATTKCRSFESVLLRRRSKHYSSESL